MSKKRIQEEFYKQAAENGGGKEDWKKALRECFEISPEYRGKGIATLLLNRICEDAELDGYIYVEARVCYRSTKGKLVSYEKKIEIDKTGICFTEGMKEGLPFLKDLADSSILFFEL